MILVVVTILLLLLLTVSTSPETKVFDFGFFFKKGVLFFEFLKTTVDIQYHSV